MKALTEKMGVPMIAVFCTALAWITLVGALSYL
jgi:hypothetical protein